MTTDEPFRVHATARPSAEFPLHDPERRDAVTTATSLDEAWAVAEAALPQRDAEGHYPKGGRFIYLYGPIASGVYWAHARLFDGNAANHEIRERKEPSGFAPVGAGPAAALLALAADLRDAGRTK